MWEWLCKRASPFKILCVLNLLIGIYLWERYSSGCVSIEFDLDMFENGFAPENVGKGSKHNHSILAQHQNHSNRKSLDISFSLKKNRIKRYLKIVKNNNFELSALLMCSLCYYYSSKMLIISGINQMWISSCEYKFSACFL